MKSVSVLQTSIGLMLFASSNAIDWTTNTYFKETSKSPLLKKEQATHFHDVAQKGKTNKSNQRNRALRRHSYLLRQMPQGKRNTDRSQDRHKVPNKKRNLSRSYSSATKAGPESYKKEEEVSDRELLSQDSLSFYVMGDIPYRTIYKGKLQEDLQHLNEGEFVVHVGGMNKPSKHHCSKTWFHDVHNILISSPIAVLSVPGSKDILDCPENEKENFNKYLVQKHPNGNLTPDKTDFFEEHWNNNNFKIHRQINRKENWSFESHGILFVGLNMVAQHDLGSHWNLIKDNESWALSRLQNFNGTSLVIFGNQRSGRALLKPVFETINQELTKTGVKQFLYVHGNGYKYHVEQGSVGHMVSVQVDKGSAAPPLKITVNPRDGDESTSVNGFEFDRRI